ncbi:MAG: hypothetical protein ABJG88_05660 [Litorimonas sp.]
MQPSQHRLRWWQLRTPDFAVLLYTTLVQRVIILPIWIIGFASSEINDVPLSFVLDTPIYGNHPARMCAMIIIGVWIYYAACMFTAILDQSYGWIKYSLIFLLIGSVHALTTYNFWALMNTAF